MENKGIIASGIVLILIIAGMFIFAYLKKSELTPITPMTPTKQETPYDSITRIDAKHFFINGTHTLVGEIAMPTPCDLLNWSTRIAESYPEQVTIDFTVVNNEETCTQVVTAQRFKVSFDASEQASIKAMLNGRALEVNLIPGGVGESPEDFELFIKG